jgi:hypothetical protein
VALASAALPIPSSEAPTFSSFPKEELEKTAYWLREFSLAWNSEVPIKLHTGLRFIDGGGSPAFDPAFLAYIDRPCKRRWCHDLNCRHDRDDILDRDNRHRTTKAFRKLKESTPREFDALYLICRHGLTLEEAGEKLTERAIRLGKPERYGVAAVLILVMSGIDKLVRWW